jgi:hypothetical protein
LILELNMDVSSGRFLGKINHRGSKSFGLFFPDGAGKITWFAASYATGAVHIRVADGSARIQDGSPWTALNFHLQTDTCKNTMHVTWMTP